MGSTNKGKRFQMIGSSRIKGDLRESLCIAAIFVCIIGGMSAYGRSHVQFLGERRLIRLDRPEEIFQLWTDRGLHGRVLMLLDRRLHVAKAGFSAANFSGDEFKGEYSVAALCEKIRADGLGLLHGDGRCSSDELNELLTDRELPARIRMPLNVSVPQEVGLLIQATKGYGPVYSGLSRDQQRNIRTLNRRLLELVYPEQCPEGREYTITGDNYLYVAIRERIIRKIIHVIPESSWDEVERNLAAIPYVQPSGGSYRLVIYNGVPVEITRLKDLPRIGETSLLQINTEVWSSGELQLIKHLIASDEMAADLVGVSGVGAARFVDGV